MKKILIVDDIHYVHMAYKQALESHDYNIISAYNGMEALEKYQDFQPDLILLDINIPVMNGLEVLKDIREFDQNVLIIIISAYVTKDTIIKASKLGIHGFISKPVDINDLITRIKNVFSQEKEYITIQGEKKSEQDIDSPTVKKSRVIGSKKDKIKIDDIIKNEINDVFQIKKNMKDIKESEYIQLLDNIIDLINQYNDPLERREYKEKIYSILKNINVNSLQGYITKCKSELNVLLNKTNKTNYEIRYNRLLNAITELEQSKQIKQLY